MVLSIVHYEGADQYTPNDVKQPVHFTAKGVLDKVTGEWITPLAWSEDQTFNGVNSPKIPGYHVVSVDKDADGTNVSYLNYIEGIPVFLNQHDLQIRTTFSTDSINVAFNSINFQIPIPFDGQTQALKPTDDVVEELSAHGLSEGDIQRIVVGFRMEKDTSHHSLINLIPTYYVKAYDEWKSVSEWKKQDLATYRKFNKSNSSEGVR